MISSGVRHGKLSKGNSRGARGHFSGDRCVSDIDSDDCFLDVYVCRDLPKFYTLGKYTLSYFNYASINCQS